MYVQLKQEHQKSHSKPAFVSNWRVRSLVMILISFTCVLPTQAQDKPVKTPPKKTTPSAKKTPSPKKATPKKPEPAVGTNYDKVAYDIYVRAGLIAYLKQDYNKATEHFKKAKPFQPPRTFTVVHGTVPTGIERLITVAKQGKSLTPKSVIEGDEKARLILMLADVYHTAGQYERSLELCNRLLKRGARKATKTQKSYAFFKRARNYYRIDTKSSDERKQNAVLSLKDYLTAQKIDPKSEWADNSLFFAANIYWNDFRNAGKAIPLYRKLLKTYPESEEADRSALFIGVCYQWSKHFSEAKTAYRYFQKQFPDTRFSKLVVKQLAKVEVALKATKNNRSGKSKKKKQD